MNPDILITKDRDGYRLLHGRLRLVNALAKTGAVLIEVPNEGKVEVIKTSTGFQVNKDGQHSPLL